MLPEIAIDPGDPAFFENPYPAYVKMQALGQVFYWPHYGHVCFPHYRDVREILTGRRFGRENPLPALVPAHLAPFYHFEAHSLLEREPPDHTRLRRLVNRAFTSRAVAELRPSIRYLANQLIDRFGENSVSGNVDLIAHYATPIPVLTIAALLGTPLDEADRMLAWSHAMVAMYQHNRSAEIEAKAVQATQEFSAFMAECVARKRREPQQDLLSELIAVEESGDRLSHDELITTAILLMNAGHEATVHAIGNGVHILLRDGVAARSWLQDPASIERAAEELMRFAPPLHMFTRFAMDDLEYGGVRLAKGDVVGVLLAAANRDPLVFAAPERLDLARRPATIMSFGAGIHFCVGAPLARLEMSIALEVLFTRLPKLQLAAAPRFADRYHFHGLEALWVNH